MHDAIVPHPRSGPAVDCDGTESLAYCTRAHLILGDWEVRLRPCCRPRVSLEERLRAGGFTQRQGQQQDRTARRCNDRSPDLLRAPSSPDRSQYGGQKWATCGSATGCGFVPCGAGELRRERRCSGRVGSLGRIARPAAGPVNPSAFPPENRRRLSEALDGHCPFDATTKTRTRSGESASTRLWGTH